MRRAGYARRHLDAARKSLKHAMQMPGLTEANKATLATLDHLATALEAILTDQQEHEDGHRRRGGLW